MALPEKTPWRPGYSLTLHKIYQYALYMWSDMEIVYRTARGVERYTFGNAAKRIESLANALRALGVSGLDRVATMDWNTHWHYETYFAAPMMGAVLHPLNVRLAPNEIAYIINHAEDRVLIVHSDFLKLAEAILPHAPSVEHVIIVDAESHPDSIAGRRLHNYEDLIKEYSGSYDWPELDENRPAAMGYTSGTTGLPKGVYHSHRMIVVHALSGALALATRGRRRVTGDDTLLHIVPMFHVLAWGLPYMATLNGMKQVFPGRLDPKVLLDLIVSEKVTITAGVPTILYMLLSHPESEKYDLSGLLFVNGGQALPRGLADAARKRGIEVMVGYGMTETAPILTLAGVPKKYIDRADELSLTTGWPVPLVELMVADPETLEPVPKDGKTMGEIVVRTPWVTPEYYKDPEKTEKAWRGGWFHTGDIAVWTPEGYIQIVDRDKDIIKSGGEWISSVRLESLISQHPGVAQVAVIGARHPKWGERPVAIIVPKPGWQEKLTTEEVREWLARNFVEKGEIPKWWLPDKVVLVDDLPKTSVGKINKRSLRERFANILEQEAQQ
ncbi:long-chain fatty acid--CoA ligase [Aeropyrum camini]|uniref:Medium-chain-fatty-acid--CoA ligase n=1 Tax=Aeropyrum camini SY1 = JCM 12091 TaxID=1198449 RepID=U3T8A3_9CREN|nr:long-chain fatty acid--CoA ligase [Aeropyrum camini]BAN89757.1 medium-chain-fatty-acid--CoA ligase [Aeropyrum camini SY1 = JCM 12091]